MRPQAGSQEAFLSCSADIVFYGGEAGSGKSWCVVGDGGRAAIVPKFGAIAFRRTSPELMGPGSLWEIATDLYPALGARMVEGKVLRATWPNRSSVTFAHMQHEKDKKQHQGKQYAAIYFDELTHFTEGQFWYLVSRNRSKARIRPYVRCTMNPDPLSWVKKMITWWLDDEGRYIRPERSGVIRWFYRIGDDLVWGDSKRELMERHPEMAKRRVKPKSFTFILGRLSDNKILEKLDPDYRANLMSLPRVERERLLGNGQGGDWKILPAAGLYFQRSWFKVLDAVPHPDELVAVVRCWDKAATQATAETPDPDWTRGVKMGLTKDRRVVVLHVESLRGSPGQVEKAIKNTAAQDGVECRIGLWQDPGQAGIADVDHLVSVLFGYYTETVRAAHDKITYAGPFSTQVEAGAVYVAPGRWNEEFFNELESFPDGKHDDQVDACSLCFMLLSNSTILAYQQAAAAED